MESREFINVDNICKIEITSPCKVVVVRKKLLYNDYRSIFSRILNRIFRKKEEMLQLEYLDPYFQAFCGKYVTIDPAYTAEDWFYLSWFGSEHYYFEKNNEGGIDVMTEYKVLVYYGSEHKMLSSKTVEGVIDIIESIFGKNSDKMRKFISPNAVKFDTTLYKYIYSDLDNDKK